MRAERLHTTWLAVWLLATLPCLAVGQVYQFTKILDGSTQRPDGLGRFYIGIGRTTPSFDGRWVVFRDPGPQNDDGSHAAIWSFDTRDSTFHKLVDFNTPIPSGAATFHDIQLTNAAPIVRNGVVVFIARDSMARQGLYSMPAGGGRIVKIADQDTPDPSAGTFTVFDSSNKQMGAFSFDGTTVAFNASGSAMIPGNYSVKPDGSALGVVTDQPALGGKIIAFYTPAISGSNVVMLGTDGFAVSSGYNGLYLGRVGGNSAVTELVNSTQQLPGNTNANFHTRFDWPVLAFDGTLLAFHATDSKSGTPANPAGLFGLYTTDLTSHTIAKIADANSTLPGLGKLTAIAPSGVAVNQGSVLFQAADSASMNGLYLWQSGTTARIAGKGDSLGGLTVQGVSEPGPAALYGSVFAFVADFGGLNQSLYLASPAFTSVSAASFASGAALAPGSIASGFGQGLATATEQASALPLPMTLANTSLTLRDSAGVERQVPLFYVSPSQINYLVPEGAAAGPATVTVRSGGQAVVTGAVSVEGVAPGLFTANSDGKGAPAGAAIAVAPDLTQTTQAVAQCGAAPGSCATSPIDLGPSGTQVVLVLYGTGIRGRSSPAGVTVKIGGLDGAVQYAGSQGQLAGLDQVNVAIPRALAGQGEVDLTLAVDGKAANTIRVNIR